MAGDTLPRALPDARERKDPADDDMRLLVAYGREVIAPRS
jgi:hypothetical protein